MAKVKRFQHGGIDGVASRSFEPYRANGLSAKIIAARIHCSELSCEPPERVVGEVKVINLEPVGRGKRIIGARRRGPAQADGQYYF